MQNNAHMQGTSAEVCTDTHTLSTRTVTPTPWHSHSISYGP